MFDPMGFVGAGSLTSAIKAAASLVHFFRAAIDGVVPQDVDYRKELSALRGNLDHCEMLLNKINGALGDLYNMKASPMTWRTIKQSTDTLQQLHETIVTIEHGFKTTLKQRQGSPPSLADKRMKFASLLRWRKTERSSRTDTRSSFWILMEDDQAIDMVFGPVVILIQNCISLMGYQKEKMYKVIDAVRMDSR